MPKKQKVYTIMSTVKPCEYGYHFNRTFDVLFTPVATSRTVRVKSWLPLSQKEVFFTFTIFLKLFQFFNYYRNIKISLDTCTMQYGE